MRLVPKNWSQFQHYKDRSPPWIKLHKSLLDDSAFQRLPDASRALAPCLWLLASEHEGGVFPASTDELAFRLRQTEKWIESALKPLISKGFFSVVQDASTPLAECLQDACLEKSREERETETEADGFEDFWKAYPRKQGKADAVKAYRRVKVQLPVLLSAIRRQAASDQWRRDDGKFIPHPATWLNGRRWEDQEPEAPKPVTGVALAAIQRDDEAWRAQTPEQRAAAAEALKRARESVRLAR